MTTTMHEMTSTQNVSERTSPDMTSSAGSASKPAKKRKANGLGHTYKMGNSYRTVIRSKGRIVTATAKTQQESRRKAKEKFAALPAIEEGKIVRHTLQKVGHFLGEWLDSTHQHEIAPSTYRRYASLCTHHINPTIGQVIVNRLHRDDIKYLLRVMSDKGQSGRSQQQAQALLSGALTYAVDHGLISSNPAKGLPRVALHQKPIKPLSSTEVKALLADAKGTFMCARLQLAMLIGLRQGEALGLRWSDINFLSNLMTISQQVQLSGAETVFVPLKTEASIRKIAIGQKMKECLLMHRQIVDEMKALAGTSWIENELVFPSRNGMPLHSKVDYSRWIRALAKLGIEHRSLHNARHTAGTLMCEAGVGIETIRRVLGHSNVLMTSRTYVHNAEQPLRVVASIHDEFLGKENEGA